jgi:hypothetical protein
MTGQLGQDSRRRQSGQYKQGRKQRTRLPEEASKDRTAKTGQGDRKTETGQLAKDTTEPLKTGQPGQVSLDRLASHVSLRGQSGWVSPDRTART